MSTRIIAGKYKGVSISVPESARPTLSRSRQSLFDMLESLCVDRSVGEFFQDRMILDCFAGSGALGLEALSRGGKHAFFVDNDVRAIKTLHSNIVKLRAEKASCVVLSEIQKIKPIRFISADKNIKCDLVFLDPPYSGTSIILQAINSLLSGEWLSENATFIIETSAKISIETNLLESFESANDLKNKLEIIKSKQISSSKFVIMQRSP